VAAAVNPAAMALVNRALVNRAQVDMADPMMLDTVTRAVVLPMTRLALVCNKEDREEDMADRVEDVEDMVDVLTSTLPEARAETLTELVPTSDLVLMIPDMVILAAVPPMIPSAEDCNKVVRAKVDTAVAVSSMEAVDSRVMDREMTITTTTKSSRRLCFGIA